MQECSNNVGIIFEISKCVVLTVKRGKKALCGDIELLPEVLLGPNESGHKFLGIFELDDVLYRNIKGRVD